MQSLVLIKKSQTNLEVVFLIKGLVRNINDSCRISFQGHFAASLEYGFTGSMMYGGKCLQ